MRQIIEVADKAVSTDDLIPEEKEQFRKSILDVARLETVLAALVESKVVAIRTENEKNGSNHSSPVAILAGRINKRFQSNSTVSSEKISKHKLSIDNVRSAEEGKLPGDEGSGRPEGEVTLQDECEKRSVAISPESIKQRRSKRRSDRGGDRGGGRGGDRGDRYCDRRDRKRDRSHERSDGSGNRSCDRSEEICWHERDPCLLQSPEMQRRADMLGSVVSLGGGEECVVVLERERARTRTRRKRRRRKHHRTIIVDSLDERVKVLDPDELPRRARWTIMVTACLLLFLCLLLVGVTLRMAPLIDDMVRQENERMIHESLNIGHPNNSQPVPVKITSSDVR